MDNQLKYLNWKYAPEYYHRSTVILETALSQVAAYQAWQKLDPGKDSPIGRRFAALPPLTKKIIREHFPQGMLPQGTDLEGAIERGEINLVKTSGTTDDQVTNIWNQEWWDASERASWKLNSYTSKVATGDHREAILVNPRNVGIISDDVDLTFEKRRLDRFLYLNEKTDPTRWTPSLLRRMVDEINTFRPDVVEANPSLLARLSRFISANRLKLFQPPVITFTYEYPTLLHHHQIKQVFSSPLVSSYGTTETGYVFMQCEAGNFHQNSDSCRVDFQPLKPVQGGPLLGRILVTPLNNPWSHFVRFDTGDLVTLEANGACACGRNSGMILSSINGRRVNLTVTTGGRLVTLSELDQAIFSLEGIEQYKLVQTDERAYKLHIVSQEQKNNLREQVEKLLKGLYGKDALIEVIFEQDIAPESSGKYLISRALFPIELEKYLETDIIFPEQPGNSSESGPVSS